MTSCTKLIKLTTCNKSVTLLAVYVQVTTTTTLVCSILQGQEVIQKKDKRLHVRRNDKDDMSHLSDEDTDPRQYERAEEQATRSARVLYMIERQVKYHLDLT